MTFLTFFLRVVWKAAMPWWMCSTNRSHSVNKRQQIDRVRRLKEDNRMKENFALYV